MKYVDKSLPQYKYLLLLAALFVTIQLACTSTVHIIVSIGILAMPASGIIFVSDYFLGDIVAEVYGYSLTRQLIWINFLCVCLFALLVTIAIHMNHPVFWKDSIHYTTVFGQIAWTVFAGIIAEAVSFFIDAYIISKTKVIMYGKKFWLRCLIATVVSEFFLVAISYSITFIFDYSAELTWKMIMSAWLFKIVAGLVLLVPASWLARVLKKAEGIDFYDIKTNYNPFIFQDK